MVSSLPPLFSPLALCFFARLSVLSPQYANLTPAQFAQTSQSSLFGKLRQRAERHGETAASVAVDFVRIDLEFRGRAAELGEFD